MRKLLPLLAGMLIPFTVFSQEGGGIGYPTVAAALEALKARSDVKISAQGGWTIVNDSSSYTIWSFTPSNHPANPTAVKRVIVSRDGRISIDMTALCQAEKTACDNLMEEFKAINAQLGQLMRGEPVSTQPKKQSEIEVQTYR